MAIALRQSTSEGNSGAGVGADVTLGAPAVAGNLLLIVLGFRNSAYTDNTIPGYTRVGYTHSSPGGLDSDSVGLWAKIAAGGEQAVAVPLFASQQPASGIIAEFSGFPALAGVQAAGGDLAGAVATFPALAPTLPGAPAVLVRTDWKKPAAPNPGPMTLTGWTLLGDSAYAGLGNRHRLSAWYLVTNALASNYAALARSSSGDAGDTGVVLTAAAYGLAPKGFPGEPGGGVW